jgi:hypothetical protein
MNLPKKFFFCKDFKNLKSEYIIVGYSNDEFIRRELLKLEIYTNSKIKINRIFLKEIEILIDGNKKTIQKDYLKHLIIKEV